jgi:predicted PurR-regulated permease PerM
MAQMDFRMTERQERLIDALLVMGTVVVAFVLIGDLGSVFFFFGDIILIFFLAWLLAFILSPLVGILVRHVPLLPRLAAVVLVYGALLGVIVVLAVVIANQLATSISDLIGNIPSLRERLPDILKPWQDRLTGLGLGQVDLAAQARTFLENVNSYASQLVGPLQQLAIASLGALGNVLIVVILSLYMVVDRDRILSFLFRLVPPDWSEEAALLETSVASSFGGFLRGQAIMGAVYAAIAAVVCIVLGIDFMPIVSFAAGMLMAIPFFGPFIAWVPPVLAAILFRSEVTLPALIAMGVGWFIVMNILQPRLMEHAVGIHPIVVLGSVLVGSKIAGVTGAIFGIPVAAVASAFFFHYFGRAGDKPAVATRAALRLAERERRAVRVPRAPGPPPDVAPKEAPLEVTPRTGTGAPAATATAGEAPPRPSTSTELAMSERTASAEAIAGRPDLSADHS